MLTALLLYALGAALMARRFRVMIGVELADEPDASPRAQATGFWAAALWPVVVAALVCAWTLWPLTWPTRRTDPPSASRSTIPRPRRCGAWPVRG